MDYENLVADWTKNYKGMTAYLYMDDIRIKLPNLSEINLIENGSFVFTSTDNTCVIVGGSWGTPDPYVKEQNVYFDFPR